MSERVENRLARLEATMPNRARRLAEIRALSPESRRAKIAALRARLGPSGVAAALARGGAVGRRIAAKLGVDL